VTAFVDLSSAVISRLPAISPSSVSGGWTVGELVADAIVEDRFLVLTAPEVADELRERARDVDAYVFRLSEEASDDGDQ
jgi:hypothetical protein